MSPFSSLAFRWRMAIVLLAGVAVGVLGLATVTRLLPDKFGPRSVGRYQITHAVGYLVVRLDTATGDMAAFRVTASEDGSGSFKKVPESARYLKYATEEDRRRLE